MNERQGSWSLSVQIGNMMPFDVAMTGQRITLGRTAQNQVAVPSDLVSSVHGAFTWTGSQWLYEDLGSANGTFINGQLFWQADRTPCPPVAVGDGTVLDIDAEQSGAHPNGVRLVLRQGAPCAYTAKALPMSGETLIGRSPECGVRLDSIRVSRRHARVTCRGGQYMLECLSSTSGVFVNGQMLQGAYALKPRDLIYLGGYLLMFAPGFLYCKDEAVGQGGVVLQVRDVTRHSKGRLNHISFDVHKGEMVAVIGGSGAGKSTLLNAISGAVKPHGGHVWYNGQDLFLHHGALKSQIGFVPQKDIMHKGITLGSMLNYAARLRLQDDVSPAERQTRVNQVMQELSIDGARNTPLKNVSGGQLKRASIAIEMLSDPELFFLDEPTSGLDPGTERHLMQTLRELTRKGKTVILITHSTLVLPLCDKVAIMGNDGNLCYYGAPEESKSFFGVAEYADIFDQINVRDNAVRWGNAFRQSQGALSAVGGQPREGKTRRARYSALRQAVTLTQRYLELILREKGWLVVMLLCAPVVMLFVSFVCNEETFVTYSATYKAMFTTICVPVFVGLLTANGEVCKERDVLYREYSANLHLGSYLVSKLVALFLLNLVQTALLTLSFCLLVQTPPRALIFSPVTEMALTLFLTMYSSTCLGLLVSTVSSSRNMATQLLAVLLVPQIVLSGCVFDLEGLTRTLAQFIHAFWGTNALCISAEVAGLDMAETVIEKGMQAGMTFTPDTPEKDYLLVSRENLLAAWRALGLLAAGCVALCYGALRLTADKFKG
ncbi:MAG: ATP-binding cassette domain-containing protein [Aristaeellaceae bacterium]